eukprot:11023588-Alexandrium_andersonii.AAC.1
MHGRSPSWRSQMARSPRLLELSVNEMEGKKGKLAEPSQLGRLDVSARHTCFERPLGPPYRAAVLLGRGPPPQGRASAEHPHQ